MGLTALTCLGGSIGGTILGKVIDCLVAPIQRQFKYICCFNSNMADLETHFKELKAAIEGVQMAADNDHTNMIGVGPEVKNWLDSANGVATEVNGIIKDKDKVKERCWKGWCPNLTLRYSLSRKAVKNTKEVIDVQAKGEKYPRSSDGPRRLGLKTILGSDSMGFESRRLKMEEIVEALTNDGINLIGICGMGGLGKTTIVKEVVKQVEENGLFEEIAWAVVSKEPNIASVQDCIAGGLGFTSLRDNKNPIERVELLRARLLQDNKKVLVILDDIWTELDLKGMGIPLGGTNKNFKILYTSRIQRLWHDLQTRKKEICLQLLLEDEAWKLFREEAGDLADARDLQPIAKQIVKKCGHLPLALALIGRLLSKKIGSNAIMSWQHVLNQLTRVSRNTPVDGRLYSSLELSYKDLENKQSQQLFLLCCCLFKEDEDIHIEDLVRYQWGLSRFDRINDLEEVRCQVFDIVEDLKSRYLLLDGKDDKHMKVHDVVRDMGISIATKSEDICALVNHGAVSQWPKPVSHEQVTVISVIAEEIEELPGEWAYSNVELLTVRCKELGKLPSNLFEGMGKLKVLELSGFNGILTLQSLRNLTTLSLEGFDGVLDNASLFGDLLNLEILKFRGTLIEELPEEIKKLVKLRLLDLRGTISFTRMPAGVLPCLVQLEELYLSDSRHHFWEDKVMEEKGGNANLRELDFLSHLKTLEIQISNQVHIPEVHIFENLKRYWLKIGLSYKEYGCEFERVLDLNPDPWAPISADRGGIASLLGWSDWVCLQGAGCNDLVRQLQLRAGVDGLQHMKLLQIWGCDAPECLANSTTNPVHLPTPAIFPILKYLTISFTCNLKEICRGPFPTGSFGELTSIDVSSCHGLENLFRVPLIEGCLSRLEHLFIEDCAMMTEVFRKDEREQVHIATNNGLVFPKLETLELNFLPSLMGFCKGIDQIDFPHLKKLSLRYIPQVNFLFQNNWNLSSNSEQNDNDGFLSLFPQKASLPNLEVLEVDNLVNLERLGNGSLSTGSFSKLKELSVYGCSNLLCVFTSQSLLMLRGLQKLTVSDCPSLEVVVEWEGLESKEPNPEILSTLKFVTLGLLPKLNCISKRDFVGYKYIQTLRIYGCDSLRCVFEPTMTKSVPQLRELRISSCEMLSGIVAEENGLGESSVNEVLFPQLKILELEDLPNLVSFFPNVDVNTTTLSKSTDHHRDPLQPQPLFNEKVDIPSLEELEIKGRLCPSLKNVFHASMTGGLVNLQRLVISHCSTLEAVVGEEEQVGGLAAVRTTDKTLFPQLKILELQDLPNLVSFFPNVDVNTTTLSKSTDHHRDPLQPQPLFNEKVDIPSLEELEIKGRLCPSLKNVFHASMTGGLVNLQRLVISHCSTLEAVVGEEEQVGGLAAVRTTDKTLFPQLKILELKDLPNLVSFFPNVDVNTTTLSKSTDHHRDPLQPQPLFNEKVDIPSLEELVIEGLMNVNLWCSALPIISLSKLKTLEVRLCPSLRNVFHASMASGLANLWRLVIRDCSTLEAVVGEEEQVGGLAAVRTTDKTLFPQLQDLWLYSLPNLMRFCHFTHPLEMPLLRCVDISRCPNMDAFSSGPVTALNLSNVSFLDLRGTSWNGDLNNAIRLLKEDRENRKEGLAMAMKQMMKNRLSEAEDNSYSDDSDGDEYEDEDEDEEDQEEKMKREEKGKRPLYESKFYKHSRFLFDEC